jgi:hypothetical protein
MVFKSKFEGKQHSFSWVKGSIYFAAAKEGNKPRQHLNEHHIYNVNKQNVLHVNKT